VHGAELWKSDGSEAGTVLVKDIKPGAEGSTHLDSLMGVVHGVLYFIADDGVHGVELWKSDGSEAGTVLVKDIQLGKDSSFSLSNNVVFFAQMDKTLVFTVPHDCVSGCKSELWKSDGSEAGTVLVKDLSVLEMVKANGSLFLSAMDDAHGFELWKSDGSTVGTILIADIAPGPLSSLPLELTVANPFLFFSVNDGVHPTELWALSLRPDITGINGATGAAENSLASSAIAEVDTVVTPGKMVTLSGSNFDLDGVAVDIFHAGGKMTIFLKRGQRGLTATTLRFRLPRAVLTGPGTFVVSNKGERSYVLKSNAVTVAVGARPTIARVIQRGNVITINGTGFSSLSVVNLFNEQSGGVVNLGGLNSGGTAQIPLTFLTAERVQFTLPVGAASGAAFVQVLNPPFTPFFSSGDDPDGVFTMTAPPL
jgi:ELWxxDGT repeat protein